MGLCTLSRAFCRRVASITAFCAVPHPRVTAQVPSSTAIDEGADPVQLGAFEKIDDLGEGGVILSRCPKRIVERIDGIGDLGPDGAMGRDGARRCPPAPCCAGWRYWHAGRGCRSMAGPLDSCGEGRQLGGEGIRVDAEQADLEVALDGYKRSEQLHKRLTLPPGRYRRRQGLGR